MHLLIQILYVLNPVGKLAHGVIGGVTLGLNGEKGSCVMYAVWWLKHCCSASKQGQPQSDLPLQGRVLRSLGWEVL